MASNRADWIRNSGFAWIWCEVVRQIYLFSVSHLARQSVSPHLLDQCGIVIAYNTQRGFHRGDAWAIILSAKGSITRMRLFSFANPWTGCRLSTHGIPFHWKELVPERTHWLFLSPAFCTPLSVSLKSDHTPSSALGTRQRKAGSMIIQCTVRITHQDFVSPNWAFL